VARDDFLLGFAQGGGDAILIAAFHAAAGKTDLIGMIAQMGAALCQQHMYAVDALHQRHQHGGGHDAGARRNR